MQAIVSFRNKFPTQSDHKTAKTSELPENLDLFGPEVTDILKQVNKLEDYDFEDEDDRLLRFSDNYDDADLRMYVTGQKKVPPTKAYVTLLALYDMLNKESKKLELNKYGVSFMILKLKCRALLLGNTSLGYFCLLFCYTIFRVSCQKKLELFTSLLKKLHFYIN